MIADTPQAAHRRGRMRALVVAATTAALVLVSPAIAEAASAPAAGLMTAPTAAVIPCSSAPFTDVSRSRAFCLDIAWLKAQGVTEGYPDGTFNPSGTVTREAMSAFLYRLANPGKSDPACVGSTPYPDVAVDNPFCGAITWLKSRAITGGYPDGTFNPSGTVTREAMSAFLYRLANPGNDDPACSASSFTDVDVTSQFCGTIGWIKGRGITTGYADGSYGPSDAVSREAMAAFLHRLADSLLTTVTLASGTFTVGPDIAPGRYAATVKTGDTGRFIVIGDPQHPVDETLSKSADGGVTSVTVTLNVGDTVKISGLAAVALTPVVPKLRTALTTGSWLVGRDIAAGSYVATPGKGQSGTLSVNVKNPTVLLADNASQSGLAQSSVTVTLRDGDRIDIDQLGTVTFTATK